MRILIVTSCTGKKTFSPENALTTEDFDKGQAHVTRQEKALKEYITPAYSMYTGQQHLRLMRGLTYFQQQHPQSDVQLDLQIVSAGYGLLSAEQEIAPYESTFQGLKRKEILRRGQQLSIPEDLHTQLSTPYSFAIILLGDDYLKSCQIDDETVFAGPTLFFVGAASARKLPNHPNVHHFVTSNAEAKTYNCGLVGLKGELAGRLFTHLVEHIKDFQLTQSTDLAAIFSATPKTSELDIEPFDFTPITQPKKKSAKKATKKVPADKTSTKKTTKKKKSPKASTPKKTSKETPKKRIKRVNPEVDKIIELPKGWMQKPHRDRLIYFIPDWDDQVDPDYDFEHDIHSGGTGDWSNQVYAHQMYPEPNYDGILISRVVAEKSKRKKERINQMGVHRYLRVPREFPVMGDCGAFDYIKEELPPFTTEELLDYYTRLDFDYGVSIDHLIVAQTEEKKRFRYELTIQNAAEFISEHKKQKLPWTPIGAVQGWDPASYRDAAKQYVDMGYDYIALGGLVRTTTKGVLEILSEVRTVVPDDVKVHLFGVARPQALTRFSDDGANSVDSASVLRKAWLGSNLNYLTQEGWFSAIRVPQVTSFRAKRLVKDGVISLDKLQTLERGCLRGLRDYAASKKNTPSEALLDLLVEYDTLIAGERAKTRQKIERTLIHRPWQSCPCAICKDAGIEVAIFRGNNRNRRRGFHNTYVFHQIMQQVLNGELKEIPFLPPPPPPKEDTANTSENTKKAEKKKTKKVTKRATQKATKNTSKKKTKKDKDLPSKPKKKKTKKDNKTSRRSGKESSPKTVHQPSTKNSKSPLT